jgi:hypothetical protein
VKAEPAAVSFVLSAAAVRQAAGELLALGLDDRLACFRIDLDKLDAAVELVLDVTRKAYPTLDVPFHARWRHFVTAGEDRWATLAARAPWRDRAERARAEFDLAFVSVLLDAGAGANWRYHDPQSGQAIGRSEGLAIASLDMFARGAFSSQPHDRLRADAERLSGLDDAVLRHGFQVEDANPLIGVATRTDLLRRLGAQLRLKPDVFARHDTPRPGGLFDHLVSGAAGGGLAAPVILAELLRHLGAIWPAGLVLNGAPLGDCWRYPADNHDGRLVPLHKLSQWLAYSLIEPLQNAGIVVTDIDGLTGLAEYRNGGLFIDAGVLRLRDPAEATRAHEVSSTLVVEWRALTVALLDKLADRLRARLGMDAQSLPLAKVLEGGTWAAGREIAYQRRPDGAPPIQVISDGSVF